ncbi:unnamed protein product [Phytophthora fragariaefolia]|uniref:Unnamed protein product n=1 Tax=Phytophthora fragariaefolia TaxID=1490495 RepID=A0A9W6YE89_9STRA|nr:unnamed protein product [Phytophthora fragariaefolia]
MITSFRGIGVYAVTPKESLYLGPGESAVVRIDYGQSKPQREVVWAGRGDRWVTQIIYAARSWPVAVKVVNISDKTVWIDSRTAVARIVEFGFFPKPGRFVRPGLRQYTEWQVMIYDNTRSRELRKREVRLARIKHSSESPSVQTPKHQWPKKLLIRSPAGSTQVQMVQFQMVQLQPRPGVDVEKILAKPTTQLSETEVSETSESDCDMPREAKLTRIIGGCRMDSGSPEVILEGQDPETILDEDSSSDSDEYYDAISFDDKCWRVFQKLLEPSHRLTDVRSLLTYRPE